MRAAQPIALWGKHYLARAGSISSIRYVKMLIAAGLRLTAIYSGNQVFRFQNCLNFHEGGSGQVVARLPHSAPKGNCLPHPNLHSFALDRSGESTMPFRQTVSVCQKCHDLMNFHSIQTVGGPDGKGYDVCVFECECGRLAAEEVPICYNQEAA